MTSQAVNFTPIAWILLIAWVVFNLVIFLKVWSWVTSVLDHGDQSYIRLQSGLNFVMVIAVVDVIWLSVILLAAGVNSESLLCLPVIFLVTLVPIYIRYRRYYRNMMRKSEDQSTD